METVVHNVRDLDSNDRSAVERLVGHSVRENQQLVIRIVNVQVEGAAPVETVPRDQAAGPTLPAWCNVYEGLSDEAIAELEKTILTRADLSRPSE